MHTSEVIYQGDLRTKKQHMKSGNCLVTDAPVDNKGKGEAFSPTDLVASSLASCMMTIMGISAREYGFVIDGAKAIIDKVMYTKPRRIGEVHITISFPGDIQYTEKQKRILRTAADTCPVSQSLHPDVKQIVKLNFGEYGNKYQTRNEKDSGENR